MFTGCQWWDNVHHAKVCLTADASPPPYSTVTLLAEVRGWSTSLFGGKTLRVLNSSFQHKLISSFVGYFEVKSPSENP